MVSKNLSVCLSVAKFDLNYLRTGEIEWAETQSPTNSKIITSSKKVAGLRARAVLIGHILHVFAQKQPFLGK